MLESLAAQRRAALLAIASKTGWRSLGELRMTRRISTVAASRSCASASRFTASASRLSASARRFSRSRTRAPSSLDDLRATEGLASLDLAGFGPRRMGLPFATYEWAGDTLGEPVGRGKGSDSTDKKE